MITIEEAWANPGREVEYRPLGAHAVERGVIVRISDGGKLIFVRYQPENEFGPVQATRPCDLFWPDAT